MKAIISHDIDHLTVGEHILKDLIIPKFIIRSKIELLKGKISFKEYWCRFSDLFTNKWQCIDEVIEFNKSHNVNGTFFIGVNNGLGLNYNLEQASYWIERVLNQGVDIGVHGIAYENISEIQKEFNIFKQISNKENFGIRMHYLRNNSETIQNLEKAGYLFDTTTYKIEAPYKINNRMWEFPLHIMEGYEIDGNKRWQQFNLQQAKESTMKKIETAFEKKLPYITILFHDRYFTKSFKTWIDWYVWVIEYLQNNKIEFVNYKQAINELQLKEI